MATKAKKPAPRKSIQSKTGAGPAVGEHSRDGAKKPAFGKAAPRKVTPPAAKAAAPAAKAAAKAAPKAAKAPKAKSGPSLATKIAHVATGAVVATAKGAASLAASVTRKDSAKIKAKAK